MLWTKTNTTISPIGVRVAVATISGGGIVVFALLSLWAPPDPIPKSKADDKKTTIFSRIRQSFVRVVDISRPRIWYIRALLRLKWNLFRQTGSGRLNARRLEEFVDKYDESSSSHPALMNVSVDFCNYAIKQLAGIYGMWWILYAFCPCFWWDEQFLCFNASRLRYMMIKYALLPTVARDDQDIVHVEDAYLLPKKLKSYLEELQRLGGSKFDENVDWCTVPRVDMDVSNTLGDAKSQIPLPLTFLPLNMAVICNNEPPAFGVKFRERNFPCPIPNYLQEPYRATMLGGGTGMFHDRAVHEASPIPVFISHRWKDQGNPNASNEFVKIQNTLSHLVLCAVQACLALLHDGFPLDLLLQHRPFLRPAFRVYNGLSVDSEELTRINFEEVRANPFNHPLQQISGHLVRDIFALTAQFVLQRFQRYETSCRPYGEYRSAVQKEMVLDVMKRIWLWYDYSSLPQSHLRTVRDDLRARFQRSLEYLPQLQNCMHTICVNDGEDAYFRRAWCMSEYMNANTSPLHGGRSLFASSMRIGMNEKDAMAYKWFELLINPTKSFNDLLKEMNLDFTDPKHAENNTPTICWIAWNSILRRENFELEYHAAPKSVADENCLRLLVGCGSPQNVSSWLECIQHAIATPIQTDPGPFWIAMSRAGSNQLPYRLHTWQALRAAAAAGSNEVNESNIKEIEVPFSPVPGENIDPFIVRALSKARLQLSRMEQENHVCMPASSKSVPQKCMVVRVYLRNDCHRTLRAENQDFVGDLEPY